MSSKVFYLPLENYPERYTGQLRQWMYWRLANTSALRNGLFVIDGDGGEDNVSHIQVGQVLDAGRRVRWATSQIARLIDLLGQGKIRSQDIIILDDFYHPGLDGLLYALHQYGIDPYIFAYCWAQSVDRYDFTHAMKPWMRHVEKAVAKKVRVFVACDQLRELLVTADVCGWYTCDVVGLPFDSYQVRSVHSEHPIDYGALKRNKVVWSSRLDSEKRPHVFLKLAERVKAMPGYEDTEFVICTSSPELRSNSPSNLSAVLKAEANGLVTVRKGLTKKEYYHELATAKVQFNAALQDWVSFTLLEAVTFGCWPMYPMYRSFPEALQHDPDFMYRPGDCDEAAEKIARIMSASLSPKLFSSEWIEARRALIVDPHDAAIDRMIYNMPLATFGPYVSPETIEDKTARRLKHWKQLHKDC